MLVIARRGDVAAVARSSYIDANLRLIHAGSLQPGAKSRVKRHKKPRAGKSLTLRRQLLKHSWETNEAELQMTRLLVCFWDIAAGLLSRGSARDKSKRPNINSR